MSSQLKPCVACDCVDDNQYHSPAGAGPFCSECWQSLTDADQSLLLEKRLEQTEELVETLRSLLTRATDALEKYHAGHGGKHNDAPCDICPLLLELRRETARGGASK
jgi:recombinational DNA repair protein (RecF pathway)